MDKLSEQLVKLSECDTSFDEFRKAAAEFAKWAINTLAPNTCEKALEVSQKIVEFTSMFKENEEPK